MKALLITVDSLRGDYSPQDLFGEQWGELKEEFCIFSSALANGTGTANAVPGIISGQPLDGDQSLPEDSPVLGEIFRDGAAFTNNPHLREEFGYARGISEFYHLSPNPGIRDKVVDFGRQSQLLTNLYQSTKAIMPHRFWNRSQGTGSKYSTEYSKGHIVTSFILNNTDKEFIWGHYMDTHFPFTPGSISDKELFTELSTRKVNKMNEDFAEHESVHETLIEIYEESISYVGRELLKLFDELKESGEYQNSMIIIVGDHGEAFGENGNFSHGPNQPPVDEIIKTPLLVKYPNERIVESFDHQVQHADILPTIAMEFDADVTPQPTTAPLHKQTERKIISKSNSHVRITTPSGYIMRHRDGTEVTNGEVSDMVRNMVEKEKPTTVESITGEIAGELSQTGQESDQVEERLEALGYK